MKDCIFDCMSGRVHVCLLMYDIEAHIIYPRDTLSMHAWQNHYLFQKCSRYAVVSTSNKCGRLFGIGKQARHMQRSILVYVLWKVNLDKWPLLRRSMIPMPCIGVISVATFQASRRKPSPVGRPAITWRCWVWFWCRCARWFLLQRCSVCWSGRGHCSGSLRIRCTRRSSSIYSFAYFCPRPRLWTR